MRSCRGCGGGGSDGLVLGALGPPEATQDEEGADAGADEVVAWVNCVLDRELVDGEHVADVPAAPQDPGMRLLFGRILGQAPPGRDEAHGICDQAAQEPENGRVELVPQEKTECCAAQAAFVEGGQLALAIFQAEQQSYDRPYG